MLPDHSGAAAVLRHCATAAVTDLFSVVIGAPAQEVSLVNLAVVLMRAGDAIPAHTHGDEHVSGVMVIVGDPDGHHTTVDWVSGETVEHALSRGQVIVNHSRTAHAVTRVRRERVTVVWSVSLGKTHVTSV